MDMILQEVHTKSDPWITSTSFHKLYALIVAKEPSDL